MTKSSLNFKKICGCSVIHNIYDRITTGFLKLREHFVTRQPCRGHDLQLYQQRSQRNLRKYFFFFFFFFWFKGGSNME